MALAKCAGLRYAGSHSWPQEQNSHSCLIMENHCFSKSRAEFPTVVKKTPGMLRHLIVLRHLMVRTSRSLSPCNFFVTLANCASVLPARPDNWDLIRALGLRELFNWHATTSSWWRFSARGVPLSSSDDDESYTTVYGDSAPKIKSVFRSRMDSGSMRNYCPVDCTCCASVPLEHAN